MEAACHMQIVEFANLVIAQLLFLEAEDPDKDIHLYINSPGGSVTAGMAIYDTMLYVKPAISRSREKMSNARSPRGVCSTTIGISAIGLLLAAFASMIALCAAWQRHDTPDRVSRSDKREPSMLTGRSCPQGLLGKRAAVVRIRQLWYARL